MIHGEGDNNRHHVAAAPQAHRHPQPAVRADLLPRLHTPQGLGHQRREGELPVLHGLVAAVHEAE